LTSPLKEGRSRINPVAHKAADTKIAVSATFSIGLANEASTSGQKEQSRVIEKKPEENKIENASFTFKLGDKKEESSTNPDNQASAAQKNLT
jgi:hypothetical protein